MNYKGEKLETIGQTFNKALEIAKNRPEEAPEFFEEYVNHITQCNSKVNKQEAINIAKENFGYFAGYYDKGTYAIMEKAYGAVHPIFGQNPF